MLLWYTHFISNGGVHMTVADVIRKHQGDLTQTEYAELLGITQGYLSLIYSGARNPGMDVQRGFFRAFPHDARMEYIAALTTEPQAEPAEARAS